MNYRTAILAASVLGLAATSALAQDVPAASAPPPGPGAATAASGHIPPPPTGRSQVVFFRTGAYMGAATWFKIRENGAELGKLSNQSYFVAVLDPGPHTFTASTENKTTLKLELDAGDTTYVRGTLQMGVLLYEPNLQPADQTLFEKHYSHLHVVKSLAADAPKEPDKAVQ